MPDGADRFFEFPTVTILHRAAIPGFLHHLCLRPTTGLCELAGSA